MTVGKSFYFGIPCVLIKYVMTLALHGLPSDSDGKESTCNAGDLGSIPESGRSPGEGIGYPLQYSCLENSMDRGAWRVITYLMSTQGIPK